MPSSVRLPRRVALVVALVATSSLVEGCKREAGQTAAQQRRAARRQAILTQNATQALRNATSGSGSARDSAEHKKANGWVVKGTDFLTFWPCGQSGYYYMRSVPGVFMRISQQYKFAAPRPYTPMFAELNLRYVGDTLRVGERTFHRYAEVVGYTSKTRDEATCAPPSRARLSDEMERLDRFKVEVLTH